MPDSARSRPVIPKVSKILPLAAGGVLVAALVSVATPALAADTATINGAHDVPDHRRLRRLGGDSARPRRSWTRRRRSSSRH